MSISKKTVASTAILFTLLTFSPASAATDNTSQIPELNPFCWHRKDCHNARKKFLTNPPSCEGSPTCKELEQGFIKDASVAPCVGGTGAEQWGRCLPAGTTKTEISFGGKDEFSNIGEFIILMYKYLVTIASIVAVVMIIIAGMQWVTSGGNSEAISSAKKRIGGALIGLFIAYMSYFVLNTINPALVNLRLPQVWLIKPQSQMTEFCADLPGATTTLEFAKVGGVDEPNKPAPPAAERDYIKWETMACGSRFLAENGGEQVCRGNSCDIAGKGNPENKTCFDKKGDGTGYDCGNVRMGGGITYIGAATALIGDFFGGAISNDWKHPPVNFISIAIKCKQLKEGETIQAKLFDMFVNTAMAATEALEFAASLKVIASVNVRDQDRYAIEFSNKEINCRSRGIQGSGVLEDDYIIIRVNMQGAKGGAFTYDEWHYLGRDGIDLGNEIFFENNYQKIDKQYLYTQEELIKGIKMNIDGDSIINVQAGGWISGTGLYTDLDKQQKMNEFYRRYLVQ